MLSETIYIELETSGNRNPKYITNKQLQKCVYELCARFVYLYMVGIHKYIFFFITQFSAVVAKDTFLNYLSWDQNFNV